MSRYYTDDEYSENAREYGEAAAAYIEHEVLAAREEAYYAGAREALRLVWEDVKGKTYQTRVRRLVGFLRKQLTREAEWAPIPEDQNPWGVLGPPRVTVTVKGDATPR